MESNKIKDPMVDENIIKVNNQPKVTFGHLVLKFLGYVLRVFFFFWTIIQQLVGMCIDTIATPERKYIPVKTKNVFFNFLKRYVLWNTYALLTPRSSKRKLISIGMYGFGIMEENEYPIDEDLQHMDGHRLLSMFTGPFHIFIIGIPLLVYTIYWKIAIEPKYPKDEARYRLKNFYVERWAEKLSKI